MCMCMYIVSIDLLDLTVAFLFSVGLLRSLEKTMCKFPFLARGDTLPAGALCQRTLERYWSQSLWVKSKRRTTTLAKDKKQQRGTKIQHPSERQRKHGGSEKRSQTPSHGATACSEQYVGHNMVVSCSRDTPSENHRWNTASCNKQTQNRLTGGMCSTHIVCFTQTSSWDGLYRIMQGHDYLS